MFLRENHIIGLALLGSIVVGCAGKVRQPVQTGNEDAHRFDPYYNSRYGDDFNKEYETSCANGNSYNYGNIESSCIPGDYQLYVTTQSQRSSNVGIMVFLYRDAKFWSYTISVAALNKQDVADQYMLFVDATAEQQNLFTISDGLHRVNVMIKDANSFFSDKLRKAEQQDFASLSSQSGEPLMIRVRNISLCENTLTEEEKKTLDCRKREAFVGRDFERQELVGWVAYNSVEHYSAKAALGEDKDFFAKAKQWIDLYNSINGKDGLLSSFGGITGVAGGVATGIKGFFGFMGNLLGIGGSSSTTSTGDKAPSSSTTSTGDKAPSSSTTSTGDKAPGACTGNLCWTLGD